MGTDRQKRLPLPRAAARCMRLAKPVLDEFFNPEEFIIGGGSALAARWGHRVSTDVDLFTQSGADTGRLWRAQRQVETAVSKACGRRVPMFITPTHGEVIFPGMLTLEWSAIPRFTPYPEDPDIESVSGLPLDSDQEILAQKLCSRIYKLRIWPIRDIYDLAWAAERVSLDLLRPAVRAFTSEQYEDLLQEFEYVRKGYRAVDRGREILEPLDDGFAREALGVLQRSLREVRPGLNRSAGRRRRGR